MVVLVCAVRGESLSDEIGGRVRLITCARFVRKRREEAEKGVQDFSFGSASAAARQLKGSMGDGDERMCAVASAEERAGCWQNETRQAARLLHTRHRAVHFTQLERLSVQLTGAAWPATSSPSLRCLLGWLVCRMLTCLCWGHGAKAVCHCVC